MSTYKASILFGHEIAVEANSEEEARERAAYVLNNKAMQQVYIHPSMVRITLLPFDDTSEGTYIFRDTDNLLRCCNCGGHDPSALRHSYCPNCGKKYLGVKGSDK